MRFLMLNWRDPQNPISGGAERVTLAHLLALVERGHEVVWYTFDFPGGSREAYVYPTRSDYRVFSGSAPARACKAAAPRRRGARRHSGARFTG